MAKSDDSLPRKRKSLYYNKYYCVLDLTVHTLVDRYLLENLLVPVTTDYYCFCHSDVTALYRIILARTDKFSSL